MEKEVAVAKSEKKKEKEEFLKTGIPGFDDLFGSGIPLGSNVIVAGSAGSGKTIFCLQTLCYWAEKGKKCLYLSFEESEERLWKHIAAFGWDSRKVRENLKIVRENTFDIIRNIDALLMKEEGDLLIDIEPVIIPKNFRPDLITVDSLSSIASGFVGEERNYRLYIEQLFRFFEKLGATSFLISEAADSGQTQSYSRSGVEEFLADSVIALYNERRRSSRVSAIEILKLRGAGHEKKVVPMKISDKGIKVYPDREAFEIDFNK